MKSHSPERKSIISSQAGATFLTAALFAAASAANEAHAQGGAAVADEPDDIRDAAELREDIKKAAEVRFVDTGDRNTDCVFSENARRAECVGFRGDVVRLGVVCPENWRLLDRNGDRLGGTAEDASIRVALGRLVHTVLADVLSFEERFDFSCQKQGSEPSSPSVGLSVVTKPKSPSEKPWIRREFDPDFKDTNLQVTAGAAGLKISSGGGSAAAVLEGDIDFVRRRVDNGNRASNVSGGIGFTALGSRIPLNGERVLDRKGEILEEPGSQQVGMATAGLFGRACIPDFEEALCATAGVEIGGNTLKGERGSSERFASIGKLALELGVRFDTERDRRAWVMKMRAGGDVDSVRRGVIIRLRPFLLGGRMAGTSAIAAGVGVAVSK